LGLLFFLFLRACNIKLSDKIFIVFRVYFEKKEETIVMQMNYFCFYFVRFILFIFFNFFKKMTSLNLVRR
jgi:hypothetical protein